MVDKIYVVEYPDLGIKQEKLLIDHSIYLEYLSLPYETKEEQTYAKHWFKCRTKGKEWFTEKSPYFKAISSGEYSCNLKESINIKVYLK